MTVALFIPSSEVVQAPQKAVYPAVVDTLETYNESTREAFIQASEVRRVQVAAERKAAAEALAIAKAAAIEEAAVAKAKEAAVQKERERQVVVSRNAEAAHNAVVFEATAYIALCDTGCTGRTAMGHDVRNTIYYNGYRVIATDPRVIPMGSIVRVSYGDTSFKAIAWDTGGHIKGHRIDVLVPSLSEAKRFGRQKISVEVLSK